MKNVKDKLNKVCDTDEDNERVSWIIADDFVFAPTQSNRMVNHAVHCGNESIISGMDSEELGRFRKESRPCDEEDELNSCKTMCSILFKRVETNKRSFHDSDNRRKFAIDWHNKLKEKIESENRPEMRKHARKKEMDVEKCDNSCIRLWKIATWKMMKKL